MPVNCALLQMSNRVIFVIFAVVCCLIAMDANARSARRDFVGEPIHNFELKTLAENSTFLSKDRVGDVWVIVAWSSWVKKTEGWNEHWKLLLEMKEYRNRLYGLNYKDEKNKAIQYLSDYGDPFTATLFDRTGRVGIDLQVYGIPELLIIANDGTLAYRHIGYLDRSEIQTLTKYIDKAIRGESIKTEVTSRKGIMLILVVVVVLLTLSSAFVRFYRKKKKAEIST